MIAPLVLLHVSPPEYAAVASQLGSVASVCRLTSPEASRRHDMAFPEIIVWELSRHMPGNVQPLPAAVLQASADTRLLLRVELNPATLREVVRVVGGGHHVEVSIQGVDNLGDDIRRFLIEGAGGAEKTLIHRLAPLVHPKIRDILVTAAIAGRHRTRVRDLAALCHMPVRTLEWQLRAANTITARQLLGAVLALHSVWRMERFGWTLKRTAKMAGFNGAESLGNYVDRHMGARPIALARDGFFVTLERFARMLGESPEGDP